MKKILSIVGARPQIIKAAAISRAIRKYFFDEITELVVHTGQHYDANMSGVFFDELQIPQPAYNLNSGSGNHGKQTGQMLAGLEEIMLAEKPDFVVVYGDTNSTLAASLAASKLHIPVAHIEAGLRSFNKSMPEEINRIATDHVSSLLFSPTQAGIDNLKREGFSHENKPSYTIDNPGVFLSGDIMYDNSLFFAQIAENENDILHRLNIEKEKYVLVTIHRDLNTDNETRMKAILSTLIELAKANSFQFIIPLHPRTKKQLATSEYSSLAQIISEEPKIKIIEPVSFLEMTLLEKYAAVVITDSGGVQKEAYFFKKPAIVLRPETEWVELVENGNTLLADADSDRIKKAFKHFTENKLTNFPEFFGNGNASEFICRKILENC